jgi:ribosomal protein S18 acetylase RimI-like enzyme
VGEPGWLDVALADGGRVTIRPIRWAEDGASVAALDASFTTDRVYRVVRGRHSFGLVSEPVVPPLVKAGGLAAEVDRLRGLPYVVVAEEANELVGVAAASLSAWNRRAQLDGLYVAPAARRRGAGRALVDAVVAYARAAGARCLWLETQNTNYPAVRFYERVGFRLCGFDDSFYDGAFAHEAALFFALDLT